VKEARAEAQRILQQAQQDEVTVRERAEAAARQFTAYLAGFRGLLQRQLAELEVLEGHNRTIVELQAGDKIEITYTQAVVVSAEAAKK